MKLSVARELKLKSSGFPRLQGMQVCSSTVYFSSGVVEMDEVGWVQQRFAGTEIECQWTLLLAPLRPVSKQDA